MRYLKILLMTVLVAVSCHKLDTPKADSSTTLSALKCFVYYDAENPRTNQELDILSGGTFNQQMGAINYTFSHEKCTAESMKRCRLEATIPSTAKLVETDAQGNVISESIGGMRDLSKARTTVYFKIIAADGSEKRYQVQFQFNK